nr:leucine-rich repeat, cysteine-containing subtype [Tanacetum cinerariifolium]
MGEEVLDLVIPYIHNVEDRSSVSLVSRKFYEIDGITRKCVTVQAYYYPNPASLSKRFPFIESLTLEGPPPIFYKRDGYVIRITPWIQQLALEFRSLKELHIGNLVVLDEDLETLARTQDLTLLAKNCCNFLISLKIGVCYLSELGDAFRYAVRLEHFGGYSCDEESDLVGFEFPQNMCSISMVDLPVTRCSIVFPYLDRIRKLKLGYLNMDAECQCLLFKRCPNLEVLCTEDVCGDGGLQVIGMLCAYLYPVDPSSFLQSPDIRPLLHTKFKSEVISHKLGVPKTAATLDIQAEYPCVAETCWIRNLLRKLHTPLSSATIVYCDNVRVLHVPSLFQYADIFTKGLPSALFDEFRDSLSNDTTVVAVDVLMKNETIIDDVQMENASNQDDGKDVDNVVSNHGKAVDNVVKKADVVLTCPVSGDEPLHLAYLSLSQYLSSLSLLPIKHTLTVAATTTTVPPRYCRRHQTTRRDPTTISWN